MKKVLMAVVLALVGPSGRAYGTPPSSGRHIQLEGIEDACEPAHLAVYTISSAFSDTLEMARHATVTVSKADGLRDGDASIARSEEGILQIVNFDDVSARVLLPLPLEAGIYRINVSAEEPVEAGPHSRAGTEPAQSTTRPTELTSFVYSDGTCIEEVAEATFDEVAQAQVASTYIYEGLLVSERNPTGTTLPESQPADELKTDATPIFIPSPDKIQLFDDDLSSQDHE